MLRLIGYAVALAACVPERSGQLTCEVTADCEAGRVCDRGFCTLAGGGDAKTVDAPPDTPPDARLCSGGDAHATDANGACFAFFNTQKNWLDAEAACVAIDMHLAAVRTAQSNDVVKTLITNKEAWVGANDMVSEMTFVWPDGSGLTFDNFRSGVPNNGGGNGQEDCLVIEGQRGATWDDRPCNQGFVYVCGFE